MDNSNQAKQTSTRRPGRTYAGSSTKASQAVTGTPNIRVMFRSLSTRSLSTPAVSSLASPNTQTVTVALAQSTPVDIISTSSSSSSTRRRVSSLVLPSTTVTKSVIQHSSSPPIYRSATQRHRIIIKSNDDGDGDEFIGDEDVTEQCSPTVLRILTMKLSTKIWV
ncbi:hypothetical protein BC830DRAFT_1173002 [Chytriomyces sp. MP71]|nr:hypothetical protein BC830DRAFT_1173002 [Chytriomyces sp. MP71]